MNRKLIFLDIDGTLTPAGSNEPPQSALDAVRSAQALGHKVFLCTGRNPAMLAPVLEYGFDGVVAVAGGYVFAGDEVLFDCPMSSQQFEKAMKLFKDNGVFRTIETKDATYADENFAEIMSAGGTANSEMIRWRKAITEALNILPMSQYDGRPVYKIVFMCTDLAQLEPAKAELSEEFSFVIQDAFSKSSYNGELINKKFDKGRGVRIITEHFGADISDTVGFGDSMNDLEMIETVGTSVCMENGSPLLKEKCDIVCPSVEEGGLAWAFGTLGLSD